WSEPEPAQRAMKQLSELRGDVDAMDAISRALSEARELLSLFPEDDAAGQEVEANLALAEKRLDEAEMAANFDGEFDAHNAIVSIFAGAGGVDAADWTQMLTRMYLRWAESKGYLTHLRDQSPAEEAG